MDSTDATSTHQINGQASMIPELEAIRVANHSLRTKYAQKEEILPHVYREQEGALNQKGDLPEAVNDASRLQGSLQEQDAEKEEVKRELEDRIKQVEDLLEEEKEKSRELPECLDMVKVIKEGLAGVIGSMVEEGEDDHIIQSEMDNKDLRMELKVVLELVKKVGLNLDEFKEKGKKEKKELEYSLVSLTEENRDVNNLLRIALVEKEAVEKRLKENNEQRRGAIFQFAGKGLQKVGFGFGFTASTELSSENTDTNTAATTSDSSESAEEPVSLASTVKRIMKNLRLEITQLRRSLDESRSEASRLQSLTEMQTHQIEENTKYIKELEDREWTLTQKIEELQREMKETEEEVARWKHACELEVQAGKNISEEYEKVINIMNQELEKSRAALNASNSKMKLKDQLVATAIAAQEAAERSLRLADSRAAEFHSRLEELTRQLEETEKKERASRRRVRHFCWPWRFLKFNTAYTTNNGTRNIRRMLPEMQALLP